MTDRQSELFAIVAITAVIMAALSRLLSGGTYERVHKKNGSSDGDA